MLELAIFSRDFLSHLMSMLRAVRGAVSIGRGASHGRVVPLRRFCTPPPGNPVRHKWHQYIRRIKVGVVVVGGLATLSAADRAYTLYRSVQCDVPHLPQKASDIDRQNHIEEIKKTMDNNQYGFHVVTGIPGVGKTRLVIEAAKARGEGVVYVDAIQCSSFKEIQETINSEYGPWWTKKSIGTIDKVAGWFYWWKKKPLVVIIDHVDMLPEEEMLRLQSFAKSASASRERSVWLVGSHGLHVLRGTTAFWTAGIEHEVTPPSASEVKSLLEHNLSPEEQKHIPEIIYSTGCNLALVWASIPALRHGMTLPAARKRIDKGQVPDFWVKLLESGPHGLEMVHNMRDDDCVICLKNRLYFRDGVCRDYVANAYGKRDLLKERTISSYSPL